MATTAIEWTEVTWNPTTGCDRVSPGCDNCLDPSTPVLMADMSWRPIGRIVVGERVVAFTEEPALGQNRVYEIATVEAVWTTRQPAVELTAGGRSIIASEDHRFLAPTRPDWRHTGDLHLSSRIVDVGVPRFVPATDDDAYLAGYAAGVICGDGTFRWHARWRSDKLGFPQSYCRVVVLLEDAPVLERLAIAYQRHGIGHPPIRRFDGGRQGRAMAVLETRALSSVEAIATNLLPERNDLAWKAGWLAGLFETDGCHSGSDLRWSHHKDPSILDRVAAYGAELGFDIKVEMPPGGSCPTAIVSGGLEKRLQMLSTMRPTLVRKCGDFVGRRFPGRHATPVDGLRRVGVRDLVDIQTSSGTFIANGFATHNCYALTLAKRLKAMGQPKYQRDGDPRTSGPGFGVSVHEAALELPTAWSGSKLVFVNSMSDLFHPKVPFDFIQRVFEVVRDTPQHSYQVLTKRSKRLRSLADRLVWPANLWMGVSVEDQDRSWRVDDLRSVGASVRFLSVEPLLGPVDVDLHGIDWVIVGGESGPRARPVDPDWVRGIRDRCLAADVPFFFKQWGGRTPKAGGRELDGRTWDQMPRLPVQVSS